MLLGDLVEYGYAFSTAIATAIIIIFIYFISKFYLTEEWYCAK